MGTKETLQEECRLWLALAVLNDHVPYRARAMRRVAEMIQLELLTGMPHCSCCLRPRCNKVPKGPGRDLATTCRTGRENVMASQDPIELRASAVAMGVPSAIRDGLVDYVAHHVPVGSFLEAVLSNDLRGACERADHINRFKLFDIVNWLYNYADRRCWGSPAAYEAWVSAPHAAYEAGP